MTTEYAQSTSTTTRYQKQWIMHRQRTGTATTTTTSSGSKLQAFLACRCHTFECFEINNSKCNIHTKFLVSLSRVLFLLLIFAIATTKPSKYNNHRISLSCHFSYLFATFVFPLENDEKTHDKKRRKMLYIIQLFVSFIMPSSKSHSSKKAHNLKMQHSPTMRYMLP